MKKQTFFPDQPNISIYQKHLPENLYDFLQENHLLDNGVHEFIKKGHKAIITVSKEMIRQRLFGPEVETVTVNIKIPDQEVSTSFIEKSWYATLIIADGTLQTTGNIKQCPQDGFSARECKKKTPKIVKALAETLSFFINPNKPLNLNPPIVSENNCCSIS